MMPYNDCLCANAIYWDFICLFIQIYAVIHREKYKFHIQGVFNVQTTDIGKMQKPLMRLVYLRSEYIEWLIKSV